MVEERAQNKFTDKPPFAGLLEGSWCGAAHLALSYPGGKCGGLSLGWASYRVVVGGTPGRRVTTGDDGDVMDLPMQLHRPPLQ